jgi:hypothetical protein
VSGCVEHWTMNATHKGLRCCEPYTSAVHTCDQNRLPTNFHSKALRDFQALCLFIELKVSGGGHIVGGDVRDAEPISFICMAADSPLVY